LHAAAALDFTVDLLPELHVVSAVGLAGRGFGELTIEPRVHCRREHASVLFLMTQRHFPIRERTLGVRASRSAVVVTVEPAKAVVGAEIVYH
jgi:hypothetical protein